MQEWVVQGEILLCILNFMIAYTHLIQAYFVNVRYQSLALPFHVRLLCLHLTSSKHKFVQSNVFLDRMFL